MSIDRYSLNTNNFKFSRIFSSKAMVNLVILSFFSISLLVSLPKAFEYRVNYHFYVLGFPNEISRSFSKTLDDIYFTQYLSIYQLFETTLSGWQIILLETCLILTHVI